MVPAPADGRTDVKAAQPSSFVRLPPDAPMSAWWSEIEAALDASEAVTVCVPDPDRGPACDPGVALGERRTDANGPFVYRPLRTWVDLAEALGGRICAPRIGADGTLTLRIERLSVASAPRGPSDQDATYEEGDAFGRYHKLEDAATLSALVRALGRATLAAGARVLVLGAHRGDELDAIPLATRLPIEAFDVVAVERSRSLVETARVRRPQAHWICGDVADLEAWELGRFDLVIAIGLLQSPNVDRIALLRTIVKSCAAERCAVVLGLPNSRMVAGDLLWGARTRNVGPVEMGLVVRDAAAIRRTLHQHRFRVFVTGKYDLLVTGVR